MDGGSAARCEMHYRRRSAQRDVTNRSGLPVVGPEIVVLQRNGLTGSLAEGVLTGLLVGGNRVHRGLGLLSGLNPDVPVLRHTGTGRDELTDDDVLLETEQRVALTVNGVLGEHPGGLLEGGRGEPRFCGQRRLRDAEEDGTSRSGLAAFGHDAAVDLLELGTFDHFARQQLSVTGLEDVHPLEHLPHDDLDVLVVDRDTLRLVDLLDLGDEVLLHRARAEDPQDLVRVDRTLDELLTDFDALPVLDKQRSPHGHLVADLVGAVVRDDNDLTALVGLLNPDPALHFADRGHALGDAGLEQLLDTGQTVGDVLTRRTTHVEGTHGQLGTGLTNGLGGDDTDSLTDVDRLACGQGAAVAGGAHPDLG